MISGVKNSWNWVAHQDLQFYIMFYTYRNKHNLILIKDHIEINSFFTAIHQNAAIFEHCFLLIQGILDAQNSTKQMLSTSSCLLVYFLRDRWKSVKSMSYHCSRSLLAGRLLPTLLKGARKERICHWIVIYCTTCLIEDWLCNTWWLIAPRTTLAQEMLHSCAWSRILRWLVDNCIQSNNSTQSKFWLCK